ncbi:DUF5990 family protein [Spirosoma fluviale]|uniref:Uncharacterized protein n=1 Tax=Spirosoma fluviale TaxID=1597977 RepID=A0A286G8K6_9BACT|nr:DUF5990 family protein [Spirosoma fluviale]SOD91851.1 hypothetical protein SAMN06269250_3672 [Spirosoma fluviale]
MKQQLTLRIRLESPTVGVDFGLQNGSGHNYDILQKQKSAAQDLCFECTVVAKLGADNQPDFTGPLVQGPPANRFVYINIGKSAGQFDSIWSRRLKVPLRGITAEIVYQTTANSAMLLETNVPGTGKDGGPTCGTVKPFNGWHIAMK